MTEETDSVLTRRRVLSGGTTVIAPALFSVEVEGQEEDNQAVMLEVNAEVPEETTATVEVIEQTDDTEESTTIDLVDGDETYSPGGISGGGDEYWIHVEMETEDQDITPEIHEATVRFTDARHPDDPLGIYNLWDNPMVFITTSVFAAMAIGLASRSMAVAAMGAYLLFAYIAMESSIPLIENILYVSLVLVFIGMAFKLWRLEGGGTGSQ